MGLSVGNGYWSELEAWKISNSFCFIPYFFNVLSDHLNVIGLLSH
jgi:hypothetical protein